MHVSDELNQQQRRAVEAKDGPVLIVAGPGAGKTKTLTARIAYLLQTRHIPASDILALTFTTKAAREVRERVTAMAGRGSLPDIATFHALGYSIISSCDPSQKLSFITEADRLALIRSLPKPQELRGMTNRELALRISRYKGALGPSPNDPLVKVVQAYNDALHGQGLLDFDDLLTRTYHLLQEAGRSIHRYRYVLIDEFQDTSELQWALVDLLCATDNIFVIGDPKQSIYSFRGADEGRFDRFRRDFPNHAVITLDTNYRSARRIVALAGAVFPDDIPLRPHATNDGHVQVLRTLNEFSEADLVVQIIEQGIGGSDMLRASVDSGGRRFADFAVLYRTHQAAKVVRQRLYDSGMPHQIVGEGSPYEQPKVQTVITALRWLHTHQQLPTVKGLGGRQVQTLLKQLDVSQPVSELAGAVARQLGLYGDASQQRAQLAQLAATFVRFDTRPNGLVDCLEYIDDLSRQDFFDPNADAVTLLTIHAAKGLEFTHVLLIAAEDGMLPHIRKTARPNFDEERRLFYVALTRAKESLDIIYTKNRSGEDAQPSRFITRLSERYLPRADDPNLAHLEKKLRRRQQKARQAALF